VNACARPTTGHDWLSFFVNVALEPLRDLRHPFGRPPRFLYDISVVQLLAQPGADIT
jgi:hypothetical protein